MKMRLAFCMTDVLMVLFAEILNDLHGDSHRDWRGDFHGPRGIRQGSAIVGVAGA